MNSQISKSKIEKILERMKFVIGTDKDGELAKYLDVKANTISGWKKRGRIDYELIFSKFDNVSLDWLINGVGDTSKFSNVELKKKLEKVNATALTKKENEKKEGNATELTKKEVDFSNEGKTKSTENDQLIDQLIDQPNDQVIDQVTSEMFKKLLEKARTLKGDLEKLTQEKNELSTSIRQADVEKGKVLGKLEIKLKHIEDLELQLKQQLEQIEKQKLKIEQKTIEETVVQEMRDEYEGIISNLRKNVVEYMVKDLQFGSAAKKRRGETVDWEEDEEEEKEEKDFPKSDSKSA